MSLLFAYRQNLGKLTIQIDTDHQIGIDKQAFVDRQMVGQRQRHCIAATLDDLDMQVASPGNPRSKATIEAIDLGDQTQQSEKITFVERHQTDEAFRPDYSFWDQMGVEQHAVNIAAPEHEYQGRTRRSIPVVSRILLEISSIENFVVSTLGMA